MKVIICLAILINLLFEFCYSLRFETKLKTKNNLKKENHRKSLAESFLSNKKSEGHMEKVMREIEEIVYVPSNKPSGLPGSFVISEEEAKGKDPRSKN